MPTWQGLLSQVFSNIFGFWAFLLKNLAIPNQPEMLFPMTCSNYLIVMLFKRLVYTYLLTSINYLVKVNLKHRFLGSSQACANFIIYTQLAYICVLLCTKYARILLFQFVFTKYVFGFRNYDGLTFVVIDVIFQNVIMRKYDKIRF